MHKFKDNCGEKQSLSGVPERKDDSEFRREPILGQEDYHRWEEESPVSNVQRNVVDGGRRIGNEREERYGRA